MLSRLADRLFDSDMGPSMKSLVDCGVPRLVTLTFVKLPIGQLLCIEMFFASFLTISMSILHSVNEKVSAPSPKASASCSNCGSSDWSVAEYIISRIQFIASPDIGIESYGVIMTPVASTRIVSCVSKGVCDEAVRVVNSSFTFIEMASGYTVLLRGEE